MWVKRPTGSQVASTVRTRAVNWDNDAWRGTISTILWHQGVRNSGWARYNVSQWQERLASLSALTRPSLVFTPPIPHFTPSVLQRLRQG